MGLLSALNLPKKEPKKKTLVVVASVVDCFVSGVSKVGVNLLGCCGFWIWVVFDFFKVVLYFVGGVDYGVNALASSWWRRMLGNACAMA